MDKGPYYFVQNNIPKAFFFPPRKVLFWGSFVFVLSPFFLNSRVLGESLVPFFFFVFPLFLVFFLLAFPVEFCNVLGPFFTIFTTLPRFERH